MSLPWPAHELHCVLGHARVLDRAIDPERRMVLADEEGVVVAVGCFEPLYGASAEIGLALRDPDDHVRARELVVALAQRAGRGHTLRAAVLAGQAALAGSLPGAELRDGVVRLRATELPEGTGDPAAVPAAAVSRAVPPEARATPAPGPGGARVRRVVVVGGGIAAAETVLALGQLRVPGLRLTLIAPEPRLPLRTLAVGIPWAGGEERALRLDELVHEQGGRFRRATVVRVDTTARRLSCATGPDEPYDVLVLAAGARRIAPFSHALIVGLDPAAPGGIAADVEQGWSRSVAFVVPPGCSWPLSVYELALLTAERTAALPPTRVALHLVTGEATPLELFGEAASHAVASLLRAARVTLHMGVPEPATQPRRVLTGDGRTLDVDRIVSVPVLEGPRIDGIPATAARGFVPVDDTGRVVGLDGVYAVGDCTDHAVKHGAAAARQADVAAAHIAGRSGTADDTPTGVPVLRGRLLTGPRGRSRPCARPSGADPLWWPPVKADGEHLSPYLARSGLVHPLMCSATGGPGIDVHVPLRPGPATGCHPLRVSGG